MTQHYGGNGYGGGGYGGTDGGTTDPEPEPDPAQEPYGGEPHAIPGRIEAEHFDMGGEGVAYHETDPPASWSLDFRPETNVDFKQAPGTTDGISVGRFGRGEWLEYTVDAEPGTYELRARVGTAHADRALSVRLDGEAIALVPVPETGWSTHQVVQVSPVEIESSEATTRTLRVTPTADGVDVDWIEFTKTEKTMAKTATIELVLEANGLKVRVSDGTQEGTPLVEGATVEVSGAREDSGTTNADGEVIFERFDPDEYHIEAWVEGRHASADATAEDFTDGDFS